MFRINCKLQSDPDRYGAPPGLPVIFLVAWPGTRRRIVLEYDPDESLNLEFTRSGGFTHDATGHQGQAAVAAYVGPVLFALKSLRFRAGCYAHCG